MSGISAVVELAKRQHGVVSKQQLLRLRVTRAKLRRSIEEGELSRILPGVYRFRWSVETWMLRAWSVSLWADDSAWLTHRSAAVLWGLEVGPLPQVDVTATHRLHGETVSWIRTRIVADLPRSMQRIRSGLPTTSVPRTLADLAGVLEPDRYELVLERALRKRLVTSPELARFESLLPKQGRAGTGTFRNLVVPAQFPPDLGSELERKAWKLFVRHRIPLPIAQYPVETKDRRIGVVDFAWPLQRVIVEVEGFEFHSGRAAWDHDLKRYNDFALLGWTVLRATHRELSYGAGQLIASLEKLLRSRGLMEESPARTSAKTG